MSGRRLIGTGSFSGKTWTHFARLPDKYSILDPLNYKVWLTQLTRCRHPLMVHPTPSAPLASGGFDGPGYRSQIATAVAYPRRR
jgi:hypothetical protein